MRQTFSFAPYASLPPGHGYRIQSRGSSPAQPTQAPAWRTAGPKPDRFGIYNVGGEVTPPVLLYSEPAVCASRMRETDAQGTVLVAAIVGTDGLPTGTDVLIPYMRSFDLAAIRATNQLRFKPATFNGVAVPVRIFVEFTFLQISGTALPTIIQRGNPMEPPLALNSIWVTYPKKARKNRLRGTVVISLVVTPEGLPAEVKLIRSVAKELDESAMRAVKRMRFKPASMNNKPVPAHVTIDVSFLLYY
jgi:TonB family protein